MCPFMSLHVSLRVSRCSPLPFPVSLCFSTCFPPCPGVPALTPVPAVPAGCYKITTVFSHAQTVVLCVGCSTVLCQPTGGKARLTEGG